MLPAHSPSPEGPVKSWGTIRPEQKPLRRVPHSSPPPTSSDRPQAIPFCVATNGPPPGEVASSLVQSGLYFLPTLNIYILPPASLKSALLQKKRNLPAILFYWRYRGSWPPITSPEANPANSTFSPAKFAPSPNKEFRPALISPARPSSFAPKNSQKSKK